jgi:hypothetical protein
MLRQRQALTSLLLGGAVVFVLGLGALAQSVSLTVTAYSDAVRFSAQGSVKELRVEVLSLSGQKVFDSGPVLGNALDWKLSNTQGQPVANGVYLYTVTVKDPFGNVTKKLGKLAVLRGKGVEAPPLAHLNISQLANPRLQPLGGPDFGSSTVVAGHFNAQISFLGAGIWGIADGQFPQLVFGDSGNTYITMQWYSSADFGLIQTYIAGTAAGALALQAGGGNVGIGTSSPSEKLTVAGIIYSTTGGIKFPDGTIQTTAATGAAGWSLTGNAGTNPATNFLGTTDNAALEIRVNNARALRIEPNATSPNIIGGFSGNSVISGVVGATIGGGGESLNTNHVTDDFGTVGGGINNQAGNGAGTTSDRPYATVGGGAGNLASGAYATVGGGAGNLAISLAATVGGGVQNTASGDSATVGGGVQNTAFSFRATVGGGDHNLASGSFATVGGGYSNTASGGSATVGGGQLNTASGFAATVGGGYSNTASGSFATVGGGVQNTAAGDYSFVVGRRAQNTNAAHDGVFLFADSNDFDFFSTAANQFRVRSTGGAQFVLGIGGFGNPTWTCSVSNGTSWSCSSDRNLKENLALVDGRQVLAQLSALPIYTWSAKGGDPAVRHMGPMAQDFYSIFRLGTDDKTISTIDLDGVALVSIQALYQMSLALEQKDKQLEQGTQEIEELRASNAACKRS